MSVGDDVAIWVNDEARAAGALAADDDSCIAAAGVFERRVGGDEDLHDAGSDFFDQGIHRGIKGIDSLGRGRGLGRSWGKIREEQAEEQKRNGGEAENSVRLREGNNLHQSDLTAGCRVRDRSGSLAR